MRTTISRTTARMIRLRVRHVALGWCLVVRKSWRGCLNQKQVRLPRGLPVLHVFLLLGASHRRASLDRRRVYSAGRAGKKGKNAVSQRSPSSQLFPLSSKSVTSPDCCPAVGKHKPVHHDSAAVRRHEALRQTADEMRNVQPSSHDLGDNGHYEPSLPGTGKTWLAYAFGPQAARLDHSVFYARMSRLIEDMTMARLDGRFPKLVNKLARVQLLILGDWGLSVLTATERRDLLEILEDRQGRGSTMITSQLPVSGWYDMTGEPKLS